MESSKFNYELQQQQFGGFKVSDHSNPNLPQLNKDEYEQYMNEILPMSAQLITNNDNIIKYFGGGDDDEHEIRCPSFYNNCSLLQNTLVNLNQNVCKNQLLFFPAAAAAASSSSTDINNSINNYVLDSVITSSSSNSDLPTHNNFITNYFNNCTPSSSSHNLIHHHHHSSYSESTSSNKTSACKDKAISRTKRVYTSSKKEAATKKQRAAAAHQFSCALPKVVKEKIGDRIAALHRLVAPFGKTDSASVLTEAIGYIHFLHHQIQTLSMPCIKPSQSNRPRCFQQVSDKQKGKECWDAKQVDLKSRGLSVVPISVAAYVSSSFVGLD